MERVALQWFEEGCEREEAGDLEGALACYDRSIEFMPSQGRAYFNRGNILLELGRPEEALEAYDRALAYKPDSAGGHYNKGNALIRLGRLEEAILAYRKALKLKEDFVDARVALGVALEETGHQEEAIACYRRALEIRPDYAEISLNLGDVFVKQERLDQAEAVFREALTLNPDHPGICFSLASVLAKAKRFDEAVSNYRKVLEIRHNHVESCAGLGDVLLEMGNSEGAISCYQQALHLDPDNIRFLNNLGAARKACGQLEAATETFRRAISIKPDFVDALSNLGVVLKDLGRLDEALDCFSQAIEIDPARDEVYHNMGVALNENCQYEKAIECYRRAIEVNPGRLESLNNLGALYTLTNQLESAESCYRRYLENTMNSSPDALAGLGVVLKDYGRLDEAIECLRKALAIDPGLSDALSILLFIYNYLPQSEPELLLTEAKRFGDVVTRKARPFVDWQGTPDASRALRIGIVSGDLCMHPVGCFVAGVLRALHAQASERIEIFAYPTRACNDDLSKKIQSYCRSWVSVAGFSDETLAKRIHADKIDILIDLSGHSGHNRLPVFAWKPAPVQVTWLGYFATTGVSEIDYLIADPWTLPEREEKYFTEKIWRLPETRLCFTAPEDDVPVSPLPALSNHCVMFGCFNNLTKMNDEVVALWARVLKSVPESRLFLKAQQLGEMSVRNNVIDRFSARGIGANRLVMEYYERRIDYLRAYHRVDIGLDPFPYTGGTTTVESLWMGVPVLTLEGDRFLSRQGVGLLMNAGLPEWVAKDEDDYVAKAVAFANELPKLALLRSLLRTRVLASPIFDAPRFAGHLEAALRSMWRRWCEK